MPCAAIVSGSTKFSSSLDTISSNFAHWFNHGGETGIAKGAQIDKTTEQTKYATKDKQCHTTLLCSWWTHDFARDRKPEGSPQDGSHDNNA